MVACIVSACFAINLAVLAALDLTGLGVLIAACAAAICSILAAIGTFLNRRDLAATDKRIQDTHDLVDGQGKVLQAFAYGAGGRDKVAEQQGAQQEGLPGVAIPPPVVANEPLGAPAQKVQKHKKGTK